MRVKKRLRRVFPALLAAAAIFMPAASFASTPSQIEPQVANPRIVAVYAIGGGDVGAEIKESVGVGILNALVDGKRYTAIGNNEAFLIEVDVLQSVKTDNTVYDAQISEIGEKFGAGFVCVAEITPTSGVFHVLTRMIDVKGVEAVSVGNAFNPLKSASDIAAVSVELVKKMAGERIELSLLKPGADIAGVSAEAGLGEDANGKLMEPSPTKSDAGITGVADRLGKKSVDGRGKRKFHPFPMEEYTRAQMTGFSLGYGLSQDADSKTNLLLLGFVRSVPIFKRYVSLNFEGDVWFGMSEYTYRYYDGSGYGYADESINMFGVSVPPTVSFQASVLSFEAGAFGDAFYVDGDMFYNAGFVAGAGIAFDKKRARRYFYRYNSGFKYVTHTVGMRWLF